MDEVLHNLGAEGSALLCGRGWEGADARLLAEPVRVLVAERATDVRRIVAEAEREAANGRWVAGYLAYEAGAAYDLPAHAPSGAAPLAWLACYPAENAVAISREALAARPGLTALPPVEVGLNVSEDEYRAAIARVKEYLAAGDTYQVNYTCHARFALDVDPLAYFLSLVRSHPVPYAAYLNLGETQVVSLSPELFLRRRGDCLESRPMKGTRPRGRTPAEDEAQRADLLGSEKDRAENLMIVDMVRNDLGRVCVTGSVAAPALFTAEKYGTVWQMTTTVTGRLREGEVLAATFPGASITGAPKRRTMEIIRELEPGPRGVYCGALGVIQPGGDFTLNLPIRTLVHRAGEWDLGIGAGIVWDSDPREEYEETLLKSSFAFRLTPELRLFETMLLQRRHHFTYLAEHLARLAASAEYWGFAFHRERAETALSCVAAYGHVPIVVRMELDSEGGLRFCTRNIPARADEPVSLLLSSVRTNSADRFLYHKTNQRAVYDAERSSAVGRGFFEVIFCNERGNLTEGAIANLFVRTAEGWLTPPVDEGLLPGIWREAFRQETEAIEQPLAPEDLARAEEIVIGNSVRGSVQVGGIWDEEGRCWWGRA